ncbi:helix-turn-helix domain-containing protein [Streptomyces sp. DG2A-72]|uniref:ArsR/SmtB family transcription factor n=1 Tax=Streptomyces sp. DG2A-72 TaxID=3051386 RepID=UPI00265B782D|nr:helix-turn-helix domain-containing protein [Streptomyces sp. DG2A-72]MDO0933537.1 helix-turn-helix domain-containing protein [Streptomyces sp. DG2A-72]
MTEPEEPKVRTLDARSLRGLAHPLRIQLLVALRRHGPATASMLAERLGESSGATSYHLRQLAAHGFVEDAPERGKGRERWWQAADDGVRFDETLRRDPDPSVRGAAAVFMHEVSNVHTQELATWLGNPSDWSVEWDRASDLSDFTLRLTPELAEELIEKMHDLVQSYASLPSLSEDTPDAETVRVHTHVFPSPTH